MLAAQSGNAQVIDCLIAKESNVLYEDEPGNLAVDAAVNSFEAFKRLSEETLVSNYPGQE